MKTVKLYEDDGCVLILTKKEKAVIPSTMMSVKAALADLKLSWLERGP